MSDDNRIWINGKRAAVLRNGGTLADIRRHSNGFLYSPTHRVSVSEELLEQLGDDVVLQFTNMDTKDVYTCTVKDFRRMAQPVQFGNFEPQRAVEIERMNHTRHGKTKHVNELVHISNDPVQPKAIQLLLSGWNMEGANNVNV